MNNQEWWKFLDENWIDLKNLITQFHPLIATNQKEFPISAPGAELQRYMAEIEIKAARESMPDIELLRESRNTIEMFNILNETWFGIPESIDSRSLIGFFELCDLCSDLEDEDAEDII